MMVCRKGDSHCAYEASDILGQGSFGTVYLAEDTQQPGRQVALKSVTCKERRAAGGAVSWEDVVAEAELLRKMKHPHVLRCYEWFEEGHTSDGGRKVWIVLDYMDGGDLQSLYIRRRKSLAPPMEASLIRRVILSVGGALEYVHGQGIVHRDVKCMNVLLSHDFDKIVLADFGLSCLLKETGSHNPLSEDKQAAVGTPSYLPPEVICGQPHSFASDAWSLGVCAFKLAALQRPFEGRDVLALTMRIVKDEPRSLPVGCAADVECAVMGLLQKDQQRRLHLSDAMSWTKDAPIARLSCLAFVQKPHRLSSL
mmetsp:Transcript_65337/g.151585  ORF Transcript_65337/g.151585 Transcript_65337/m.151585 type:complete len:310 (-) Transcript_65337:294-1223(-)